MEGTPPEYEGHLDRIDNGSIYGWARDRRRLDEPIAVDVYVDNVLVRSVVARLYRQDLELAGKGSGHHAFALRLPDRFLDGQEHLFQARYHGTDIDLHGSPQSGFLAASSGAAIDRLNAEHRAQLDERVRHRGQATGACEPKVSVIIPCFNLGQFLDEAVDSVLAQTFEDFEIVIVDDGSTDPDTRDLLESYDRPQTRVLFPPHQGVAGARNFGIAHSTGRYLCFLDADDKLDQRFLEKTIAPLETDSSLAFVSCWLRTFGSEDWIWRQSRCDLPALLAECTVLTASPVRRSVIEEIGGFDPASGELFAEDWDLWISVVKNGHRGMILPEVLFYYRRYAQSNSRRWDDPEFVGRVARILFARHEQSYRDHLFEVLLLKEGRAGELLRSNYDLQREVENRLAPAITDRRAQIERLRRRLDGIRSESPLAATDDPRRPFTSEVNPRRVEWGDLDRLGPLSSNWGFDRGTPVDRYYIEAFLGMHVADVRGDVLEVGDAGYTRRFGGAQVVSSAVIDVEPGNLAATIIADLRKAASIPSGQFDCFIMTQTAYLIDDIDAVLAESARILRPGGVLLATLPCAIRLEPITGLDADFWRLGPQAAREAFARAFPAAQISVMAFGNLLASVAFLYGLAYEELTVEELQAADPRFPLTIGIRAVAAGSAQPREVGP